MLYLRLVYAVAKQWYDDPKSKQLDANWQSIGKGANIFLVAQKITTRQSTVNFTLKKLSKPYNRALICLHLRHRMLPKWL